MGGDVTVRSTPGQGSVFTVLLVVGECADLGDEATDSQTQRPRLVLPPDEAPPRVLVVDDIAENRSLLCHLMQEAGFECREACSGQEAIDVFRVWPARLILMDLRMPGMDGDKAIVQIRDLEGGRAAKVIVLTASAFEENRQHVLFMGADDFMGKPFRTGDLLLKIAQLLRLTLANGDAAPAGLAPIEGGGAETPLSAELLEEWRQALREADLEHIEVLQQRLADSHPHLAARVAPAIKAFDHSRVLSLLTSPEASHPSP
jgi:CheY-like chemotaxis protein